MIRTCQCPSCGAKVDFRASSTLLAVCEYCQSTLIRTDVDVENIGKMADLLPDSSLLQIGAQGKYKGMNFAVIGRVKYQHETGIWNEWHLLFDNGKTGWLSEASGSFVLSFLSVKGTPALTLQQYKLDLSVPILGQRLTVTNIENARCIAGQGELPFKVQAGFDVTVVDLNNESTFASLDFSETPPLLFVGEQVELSTLALDNLRDINQTHIKVEARSFNCPSCAAPVQANLTSTQTVVCGSCTALLDVSHKNVEILVKSQSVLAKQIKPVIKLGKVGRFEGVEYTVIGYLKRATRFGGVSHDWDEYLLHQPSHGFRWLIATQGHWTFAHPLQKKPTEDVFGDFCKDRFLKTYRHFSSCHASVVQVLGEFYWQVKLDDKVFVQDFINPPDILSKEKTAKETTWTAGKYISTIEVERAFEHSLILAEPRGIASNQPSPYDEESNAWLVACLFFLVFAFGMQLLFTMMSDNRLLLSTTASFQKNLSTDSLSDKLSATDNATFQSPVFNVNGHASNVLIKQSVNLYNNWLATDVALVEQNTGVVFHAEREASYYAGSDSDGSWSEDNGYQEIMFSNIPAGLYYLKVDADSDWARSINSPVSDYIKVYRDVPQWSNLWFLWAFILTGPIIFFCLRYRFEIKRWAESDHPIITSS